MTTGKPTISGGNSGLSGGYSSQFRRQFGSFRREFRLFRRLFDSFRREFRSFPAAILVLRRQFYAIPAAIRLFPAGIRQKSGKFLNHGKFPIQIALSADPRLGSVHRVLTPRGWFIAMEFIQGSKRALDGWGFQNRTRGMGIAVPNPPLSKNNDLTQKLLDYVRKNGHAKTGALIEVLGSPRRSVIRMLNKLIADGRLVREGNGPGAVYKINEK